MGLQDLPPELRISIYEFYVDDLFYVDDFCEEYSGENTCHFAKGKILPPALARVCKQVNTEFMPMFDACVADGLYDPDWNSNIKVLSASVFNLDFLPLMNFVVNNHPEPSHMTEFSFRHVHLTLVFTKDWVHESMTKAEKTARLKEWADWLAWRDKHWEDRQWYNVLHDQKFKVTAKFDWEKIDIEHAFIPRVLRKDENRVLEECRNVADERAAVNKARKERFLEMKLQGDIYTDLPKDPFPLEDADYETDTEYDEYSDEEEE